MPEPKVTNQELLLQIVRDIEILKANSMQILQASQDHETRIRELEKVGHKTSWIPSAITAILSAFITSLAYWILSKGFGG
jgi:hypothetical protein